MILYADILFLIDFSMDVISLYVTGLVLHSKMKVKKTVIAASVGATVSVALTMFPLDRIFTVPFGVVVSIVMCMIAFGKESLNRFFKKCIIFWTVGFLLGGIMTYLMSIGYTSSSENDNYHTSNVAILIPLSCSILILLYTVFSKTTSKEIVDVKIINSNKSVKLSGLVDSGNLLKDPFTGEPVVIVFFNKIKNILSEEEVEYFENIDYKSVPSSVSGKIRFVPASGIDGCKLLKAFKPENLYIDENSYRAIVAISPQNIELNDYDCIVPKTLLR